MGRRVCAFALVLVFSPALVGLAWADGVNVGEPSRLRKLVPAAQVEQSATTQYTALLRQAEDKRAGNRYSTGDANNNGAGVQRIDDMAPGAGALKW